MSLFAIGDLHLSFGVNKQMDIFSGWECYQQRLEENWRETIEKTDTVVIAGDISWGMTLEQAKKDFAFLESLPGQKILMKGNHDYWFSTRKKAEDFFAQQGFSSLRILFNNAFEYQDISICGTRSWINEPGQPQEQKVMDREVGRMKLSLSQARQQPLVFLHYPPLYRNNSFDKMIDLLQEYQVKEVYYGHLHEKACHYAVQGEIDGIRYRLISADYLQFKPLKIK